MEEPVWLDARVVRAIHYDQMVQHGGARGMRDAVALESALSKPRSAWAFDPGADISKVAAAYAGAIAQSRAFDDGNARTALAAMLTFLELNAAALDAPEPAIAVAMRRLASARTTEEEFAGWVRQHLRTT